MVIWKKHGTSNLEKHHIEMTLLLLQDSCEFIYPSENLTETQKQNIYQDVEFYIKHAILSTDLSLYFARKKSIENMADRTLSPGYWGLASKIS